MAKLCPSCGASNEDGAEVCFHCRAVLTAITRGTRVAGRYRVLDLLGRGGMGAVYRAHDEVLDEEIALKVLRPEVARTPEMAARFRSEIKLARRVSHFNVCRIHDYGEDGALQYISMELVRGKNLRERIQEKGSLPEAEGFTAALHVAEGLAAIHRMGIVHRDLKTANVMIDEAGVAKVMDFGIAKALGAVASTGTTGYVLGSPEYMSPEQARGRALDARTDLYSLGIVVFEMFTGRVPFRGENAVATLVLQMEHPPPLDPPPAGLPPSLVPVLRRALAKEPADRDPSAETMADAIRDARDMALGGRAGDTVRVESITLRGRRAPRTAALLAFAGATLVAGAWWIARRDAGEATAPVPVVVAPPPSTTTPRLALPSATATTSAAAPPVTTPPATPTPSPRVQARPPAPLPIPPVTAAPLPAIPPSAAPSAPTAESATPTVMPSPSPRVSPRPTTGWLLVLVSPWADVTVDGRPAGQTPLSRIEMAPGPHTVVLTHPDYEPYTRRVVVKPGETSRLSIDLTNDAVRRSRR